MTKTQKIIKYCVITLAVFLIVSIFSALFGVISSVFFLFGKEDNIVGELLSYGIFEEDDIKNLRISIDTADLEIKNGEDFSVESNHKYLKVRVKNGTLVIEDERRSLRMNNTKGAQVILTVPDDFSFDRAEIETGVGNLTVQSLYTSELSMELGAGETIFENLNVTGEAEIQTGVGKFSILDGSISELDMEVGVGGISVTAELLRSGEIECGIGNTEIFLLGEKEDYTVSVSKGMGAAKVDGEAVSNDEKIGNGAVSVEINGGIGDVQIQFAERS